MNFSERLKDLRTKRGMSQMELARAISVSQSAVAKWELGKTEPTASALIAIANFFDESVEYVLGLEN